MFRLMSINYSDMNKTSTEFNFNLMGKGNKVCHPGLFLGLPGIRALCSSTEAYTVILLFVGVCDIFCSFFGILKQICVINNGVSFCVGILYNLCVGFFLI
jgi:hypothetical protein